MTQMNTDDAAAVFYLRYLRHLRIETCLKSWIPGLPGHDEFRAMG
jgi:hypothetical protein